MKKFLIMLCAILGFSFAIYADVTNSCKISGSQDGATVIASIIEVGDGYVLVELDNDGTFAVNVTVKITSSHGNGQRGCKVSPQASNTVKVPITNAKASHKIYDYSVKVSGSRCQ